MGCKYTFLADLFNVGFSSQLQVRFANLLFEKRQTEKGGMALVHMEGADVAVAKPSQQFDATDSEYSFLAEAVVSVASVKMIGEGLIPG
jgi:hypothetical protein